MRFLEDSWEITDMVELEHQARLARYGFKRCTEADVQS